MAPEIIAMKWLYKTDYIGYNKSVDFWSLGMVFVEFLCGYNPIWNNILKTIRNMS